MFRTSLGQGPPSEGIWWSIGGCIHVTNLNADHLDNIIRLLSRRGGELMARGRTGLMPEWQADEAYAETSDWLEVLLRERRQRITERKRAERVRDAIDAVLAITANALTRFNRLDSPYDPW